MWHFPNSCLTLFLCAGAYVSHALVLHGTQLAPPRDTRITARSATNITFTNANGTLGSVPYRASLSICCSYITNITVNGQNLRVALSTGSSDLFIVPHGNLSFNDTGIKVTDTYGGGNVVGTIGFGTVQLGNYTVDKQAFNNATSVGLGAVLDLGLDGLLGLSFDGGNLSNIQATLSSSGWDSNLGEPFLYNIFDQTPNQNNFIGVSLSRTGDLEDSADASFTINELDELYAAVVNAPQLPLFPGTNSQWSILLDGISVDGNNISLPTSTVPNAPAGKIVAVLDVGTPYAFVPENFAAAMYSSIPGAQVMDVADRGPTWTVPCNSTAIVTLYFGGQPFPIHPLDLSDVIVDSVTNATICVTPLQIFPGDSESDATFGDTFLRNMYSVFNFGDAVSKSPTGSASMQLLAQTDPTAAAADVLKVRMPQISSSPSSAAADGRVAAALENANQPSSTSDSEVKKWAPIIIGLLVGNLFVVLLLAAIGLALCVKRGGKSGSPKSTYSRVRFGEDEARPLDSFEDKRYSD
ncbi:aspartic peptidase domain-containing protein [Mycena latifolia]|nr:aspartic peptidase domain-containing protein [Mycena latifolia]